MSKYIAGFLHGATLTILWILTFILHPAFLIGAILGSMVTIIALIANLSENWNK